MAREAEVPLSIDDFDGISARTPVIVDIKPGGRFMVSIRYFWDVGELRCVKSIPAGWDRSSLCAASTIAAQTQIEATRLTVRTTGVRRIVSDAGHCIGR